MFLLFFIIFLAGLSEGAMDTLQFHYYESIFKDFKNQLYWNPEISWKNKYKDGDSASGPRFPLSTTFLVGFTDAWHTFKFLRNIFLYISLPVIGYYSESIVFLVIYVILSRTVYGLGFWISYYKILIKK
jgi:hypothetical protein